MLTQYSNSRALVTNPVKEKVKQRKQRIPRLAMSPELKEFSVVSLVAGPTLLGTTVNLTNMAQGDDITQRTGRFIYALYVDCAFTLVYNTATDTVLVSIAVDRQGNNSLPGFTDCFSVASANAGNALPNTLQYRDRWNYPLITQMNIDSVHTALTYRVRVPINRRVEFNATGAGFPNSNGIVLAYGGIQAVASAVFQYNCKLVFTDV